MGRMFVEAVINPKSPREAAQKLMADLDAEAAKEGFRVVGRVVIMEFDHDLVGWMMRLEADVEAAS